MLAELCEECCDLADCDDACVCVVSEGVCWRNSVKSVVTLQSVTMRVSAL